MSPPRALFPRRRPTVDASSLEDGVEVGVELVVVVVVVVLRARRARRRVSIRARAHSRRAVGAGDHATTPACSNAQKQTRPRTVSRDSRIGHGRSTHWRVTMSDEYLVVYDHERYRSHTRRPTAPGHPGHRPTDRRETGDGRARRREVGPSVRRSVGRRARLARRVRKVASTRRRSIRIRIRIRRRHGDEDGDRDARDGIPSVGSRRRRDDEDVVEEIDAGFVRGR